MRVEAAEIGTDVGAIVVDGDGGPVVLVDPRLSSRERMRLISSLLTDEEFVELCSPFPLLTLALTSGRSDVVMLAASG